MHLWGSQIGLVFSLDGMDRFIKRERGRSPSEQRGIHIHWRGFFPIFSEEVA